MCGGNPNHDAYGFCNWGTGYIMAEYYTTGSTGRFLRWWNVATYAAFTIASPDMIALAAGEIVNPRRTIPRMAKLVFYRLFSFYVIGVIRVGILCSSQDPLLLGALDARLPGAAASPWVIGIQNLGITGLPHIINSLFLLSGWSCDNAYLYSSSQALYSLAKGKSHINKCIRTGPDGS
jgi:amino acid transporter